MTNDSGFLTSSDSCNYANSAGTASSATTAETVNTSVAAGSTKALVHCIVGENDAFRIMAGGKTNEGWVEIATSDDANEPIYVRQYMHKNSDMFNTLVRTLTLLDESGNTQFPGTVTATTFTGNVTGNCSGSAGSVAWSNVSDKPTIPTKTSDLTNDSGFLTSHQDLSGYVPRSGGAVMTGRLYCVANDPDFNFGIGGGTTWHNGGYIELFSSDFSVSSQQGVVRFQPAINTSTYKQMNLHPSGTWTWDGTACQITSDQRYKQQISEIDDKLLDAWEDVEPVQFKYNDAVNQKGTKARLHTGYVVQQIDDACKSHNVDISDYGLYCHEVYQEETEEVEVTQDDGTTTKETKVIKESSEHYSLRYTETLVVECAYLRREVSRLKHQNENFEQRLKMLEQSVK